MGFALFFSLIALFVSVGTLLLVTGQWSVSGQPGRELEGVPAACVGSHLLLVLLVNAGKGHRWELNDPVVIVPCQTVHFFLLGFGYLITNELRLRSTLRRVHAKPSNVAWNSSLAL